MTGRAIAYNRWSRKGKARSVLLWTGRIDRSLRNLKVSHSKVRIQIGMLRESVDSMNRQIAQQRADIHAVEKAVKEHKCQQ